MKNEELHNLLISIRDSISGFLNGRMTFQSAKEKYSELYNTYKEIKSEIPQNNAAFIEGLLYQHNVNNYAKATAVYHKVEDTFEAECILGDETFNDIIKSMLHKTENLKFNYVNDIFIEKKDVLTFILYVYPIKLEDATLYRATIKSSHYFNIRQFELLCEILQNIYAHNSEKAITFSYTDNIIKEVQHYIQYHPYDSILIDLFVFDNLGKVFEHFSTLSLRYAANSIIKILTDEYKDAEGKVFTVSFSSYIVIHNSEDIKQRHKEIDFEFNSITLLYKSIQLPVDTSKPIHILMDEIHNFENYVFGGDTLV